MNKGDEQRSVARGISEMVAAGTLWGVLPLYWKLLDRVSPLEILAHRIIWSFLLITVLVRLRKDWQWPRPKQLGLLLFSSLLIGGNWLLYIYAVHAGHVLECSLGYFIMPLVSVVLGLVLLHEKLSRRRQAAIALVVIAVGFLMFHYGRPPYIALTLALTFSLYGLVRKQLKVGALQGTLLETAILLPVAFTVLGWLVNTGDLQTGRLGITTFLLLVTTGVVTTAPIVLSISASKKLPLTTLGLLQYLAPSIQFLLAISIFGEPLHTANIFAFTLIWIALLVYSSEMFP